MTPTPTHTAPEHTTDERILRDYRAMKAAFPDRTWAVHVLAVAALLQEPTRRVQGVIQDYEMGIGAG